MRIFKSILVMFIMPAILFSQSQLEQYQVEAAENNPGLRARFNQYRSALERANAADALPDAEVMFGYFLSPVETRVGPQRFRASLTQMFPWFGKVSSEIDYRTEQAKIRFEEAEAERNRVFFDVERAWYNIYSVQAEIDALNETIALAEAVKRIALVKYENTLVEISKVIRLEILIEDMKIKVANLQQDLAPLTAEFNQVLNRPPGEEVTVAKNIEVNPLPAQREALVDSLLANNPDIQILNQRRNAAVTGVETASTKDLPMIGGGLEYIYVTPRSDMEIDDNGKDAILARISVSIPWSRTQYDAQVAERVADLDAIEDQIENQKNQAVSDFEKTYRNYQNSLRVIALLKEQIRRTQFAYEIIVTEFTVFNTDFEDLIEILQKLIEYKLQIEKEKAKANVEAARINMLLYNYRQ